MVRETCWFTSARFHVGTKVFLGAGRDEFFGGVARDVLYGGNGADLLFGQKGNDKLVGQKRNDTLKGGAHRDLLKGGADDDGLEGGGGKDRLVGGKGADRFIFGPKHGSDKVRDFELEVDLVYLSRKEVAFTLDDTEDGAVMSMARRPFYFRGLLRRTLPRNTFSTERFRLRKIWVTHANFLGVDPYLNSTMLFGRADVQCRCRQAQSKAFRLPPEAVPLPEPRSTGRQ